MESSKNAATGVARGEPMAYICGDCQTENSLKVKDAIKCRECGHRVLYKKRARKCKFSDIAVHLFWFLLVMIYDAR
uniref:DNA-directed RNA polymerases I, II, and III subunit RPABC4 n=1 Tax=Rhabditophanes sp. KR3021 TaxID=114890 RepID=A0AC35TRC1_9BILA